MWDGAPEQESREFKPARGCPLPRGSASGFGFDGACSGSAFAGSLLANDAAPKAAWGIDLSTRSTHRLSATVSTQKVWDFASLASGHEGPAVRACSSTAPRDFAAAQPCQFPLARGGAVSARQEGLFDSPKGGTKHGIEAEQSCAAYRAGAH